MKVTTDACLFGALMVDSLKPETTIERALDIGTGTGLLALMLAQHSPADIEAVEIDKAAFEQAKSNFEASPWADRIKVHHRSLQAHSEVIPRHFYDLIVCNPPFFSKHPKGSDKAKNKALHDDQLPYKVLAKQIDRLLADNGTAWVLYPHHEMSVFIDEMARYGFRPQTHHVVYNHPDSDILRCAVSFVHGNAEAFEAKDILIRDHTGQYSPEFTALLKDYYLHL